MKTYGLSIFLVIVFLAVLHSESVLFDFELLFLYLLSLLYAVPGLCYYLGLYVLIVEEICICNSVITIKVNTIAKAKINSLCKLCR